MRLSFSGKVSKQRVARNVTSAFGDIFDKRAEGISLTSEAKSKSQCNQSIKLSFKIITRHLIDAHTTSTSTTKAYRHEKWTCTGNFVCPSSSSHEAFSSSDNETCNSKQAGKGKKSFPLSRQQFIVLECVPSLR